MSVSDEMVEGISVVTTTWNEKENIKELIQRVRSVLTGFPHEIIVVDDSSTDGTLEIAKNYADVAIRKVREGQTKGLLYGMQLAKFPIIVTIDSDLENDPEFIPALIKKLNEFDVVVASRTVLPRFSEKLASRTIGKSFGIYDFFSNYRAYKKETISKYKLKAGETFGAELLVIAKKNGFKIGQVLYEPPPRRSKPRIGGTVKANLRILTALLKAYAMYKF